jgi:hypothetical protein
MSAAPKGHSHIPSVPLCVTVPEASGSVVSLIIKLSHYHLITLSSHFHIFTPIAIGANFHIPPLLSSF